jgi:hypothetical protein
LSQNRLVERFMRSGGPAKAPILLTSLRTWKTLAGASESRLRDAALQRLRLLIGGRLAALDHDVAVPLEQVLGLPFQAHLGDRKARPASSLPPVTETPGEFRLGRRGGSA